MKLSGWHRQDALKIFVLSLGDVDFERKIIERAIQQLTESKPTSGSIKPSPRRLK